MWRFVIFILIVAGCRDKILRNTYPAGDSLISDMRSELARKYNDKDIKETRRYLDSLYHEVSGMNDPAVSSVWFAYKARTFFRSDKDRARSLLDSALHLAELSKQSKAKVIAKMQFVAYLIEQQHLDSALKNALEAIEMAKSIPPPELPLLYSQLSYLYRAADDSINYRKYLFDGLRISKDPIHIAAFSSQVGRYYIDKNRVDSAVYFIENFQRFNEFSADYIDGRKFEDIGYLLLSQGRTKEGIELLRKAIDFYKKDGTIPAGLYLDVGIRYRDSGNIQKAAAYLDTALMVARNTNDLENISNTIFHKSTILLKEGKPNQAYQFLDSSYIYHLQYDTIAFRNNAKEVETKTVAQIKDQQIASLAQAKKAAEKISRQQRLLIIILIVVTILAAALGIAHNRRRKLQQQLIETEWQQYTFRSQMEPHFMANALNALQSFIRGDNQREAIDYVQHLSRILRQSFRNATKSFVPLNEELNFLHNYLSLQALQLENKFEYKIETGQLPETDSLLIPPMILQPFLENTIMHGFANLEYKGKILIEFSRQNGSLHCLIDDNGAGLIRQESGTEKREHSTAIIRKRLLLLSRKTGRKASLNVTDKSQIGEESGVKVLLEIPFIVRN